MISSSTALSSFYLSFSHTVTKYLSFQEIHYVGTFLLIRLPPLTHTLGHIRISTREREKERERDRESGCVTTPHSPPDRERGERGGGRGIERGGIERGGREEGGEG